MFSFLFFKFDPKRAFQLLMRIQACLHLFLKLFFSFQTKSSRSLFAIQKKKENHVGINSVYFSVTGGNQFILDPFEIDCWWSFVFPYNSTHCFN